VGSTSGDKVGYGFVNYSSTYPGNGIVTLDNGNILVLSRLWSGGRGAVTWIDGTAGLTGTLSGSNSLVGASTGDSVGGAEFASSVSFLSNGDYLVVSSTWGGGKGAVAWGSSTAGVAGVMSDVNSLVGSTTTDNVGSNGFAGPHRARASWVPFPPATV
jgi:hypothetical protein